MGETFGSTCHGAGRARSRNNSRNKLDYQQVLDALKTKGIAIRWGGAGAASPACSTSSRATAALSVAGSRCEQCAGVLPP